MRGINSKWRCLYAYCQWKISQWLRENFCSYYIQKTPWACFPPLVSYLLLSSWQKPWHAQPPSFVFPQLFQGFSCGFVDNEWVLRQGPFWLTQRHRNLFVPWKIRRNKEALRRGARAVKIDKRSTMFEAINNSFVGVTCACTDVSDVMWNESYPLKL